MSFNYKNPVSPVTLTGPDSVSLDANYGSNFSVLAVGGYMEVYSHQDLNFIIPSGSSGTILYSGNTIPIDFSYGAPISNPDAISLASDGISSGRRRLGMLAYVITADTTYQYTIDDYSTLFNAAETAGDLLDSGSGYVCYNTQVAGQNFINAWTGSTIEGVNGVVRANARWRVYTTGGSGGGGSLSVSDDSVRCYSD
jgi:hypothetical protein